EVVLEGRRRTGNVRSAVEKLPMDARAVSAERVIVDLDQALAARLGGHSEFVGLVHVLQILPTGRSDLSSSPRVPVELDLFPHSLHRLASGLVSDHSQSKLLEWLGL